MKMLFILILLNIYKILDWFLLRLIILHENAFLVSTKQPILEIMVVYENNIENSGCVQN